MARFADIRPEDEAVARVEAHVAEAEQTCSRMRLLIERMRTLGQDPTTAEIRLAQFDQAIARLWASRRILLSRAYSFEPVRNEDVS
ncbi:hypothetical protein [Methylobacterium nigriterrae]|uniref:hypothetical protein n=1 Tax=Methylobacterium nigriterrae TaxID=3127512 RepID=UPI003013F3A3